MYPFDRHKSVAPDCVNTVHPNKADVPPGQKLPRNVGFVRVLFFRQLLRATKIGGFKYEPDGGAAA